MRLLLLFIKSISLYACVCVCVCEWENISNRKHSTSFSFNGTANDSFSASFYMKMRTSEVQKKPKFLCFLMKICFRIFLLFFTHIYYVAVGFGGLFSQMLIRLAKDSSIKLDFSLLLLLLNDKLLTWWLCGSIEWWTSNQEKRYIMQNRPRVPFQIANKTAYSTHRNEEKNGIRNGKESKQR